MEDFDLLKAFSGVDLLQVEAISVVVGKALAAIFKAMVDSGITENQAHIILHNAIAAFFSSTIASISLLDK